MFHFAFFLPKLFTPKHGKSPIWCEPHKPVICGKDDDVVCGTDNDDTVKGGDGCDSIVTGGGCDVVYGIRGMIACRAMATIPSLAAPATIRSM